MCVELPIVAHCKADSIDVYIGRNRVNGELKHMNNTPIGDRGWLGNPYPVDEMDAPTEEERRKQSVNKFAADFEQRLNSDPAFRKAVANLQGKVIGCWCRSRDVDGIDPLCHGDIIRATVKRMC